MIEFVLVVKDGILQVEKYDVGEAFRDHIDNHTCTRKILYSVMYVHCLKNQGSFKLRCARSINFSALQTQRQVLVQGPYVLTNGHDDTGRSAGSAYVYGDPTAEQRLTFEAKTLFYVDEKNRESYLGSIKRALPYYLLNKKSVIDRDVHFWLEYDEGYKLLNETISVYLSLEYE